MRDVWIGGRWVEKGLVGRAGVDRSLRGIIDLQNDTLGAILAKPFFAFGLEVWLDSAATGSTT